MSWNGFRGAAARLDDIDLPRVGHTIGVGEDELHAFMDVEAAGSGFDRNGRPKMLFEPHVFYRNLSGAARDRAVREGLAYSAWKPGAYPADSYPRLQRAIAINEGAALRASSWVCRRSSARTTPRRASRRRRTWSETSWRTKPSILRRPRA